MLNKLILIGASRGIGRRFVEQHADISKKILAIGSSHHVHEVKSISDNIEVLQLDICDLSALGSNINLWFDSSPNDSSERIGIVCFASKLGDVGGLLDTDPSSYLEIFKCNLFSHLTAIKAVAAHVRSADSLRVLMFGGGGAAYGYPDFFGYSLTKVATIRAVENLGIEFSKLNMNASVVALAPGAVDTDMLKQVVCAGGHVKTKTDISEPVSFVRKFLLDQINSPLLNGRFLHVRDEIPVSIDDDLFTLRRVQ
jgi:NAD(P)-dependent dehydrogenase (short-subunit alcohol dehydrogenase family)